jgi:hypothetical protein
MVLLVMFHFLPPERYRFYPRCLLHAWTGLYCPGCGSSRALHALTRGDVRAALASNVLLTAALPLGAALLVARRWRHGDWAVLASIPAWGWWIALAIVIGFGILRNIPLAPLRWLAP